MIVYKIDKHSHYKSNSRIKEMDAVLSEIPTSLHILAEKLEEQAQTISTPSIDGFRYNLQQAVREAIVLTTKIAEESRRLINISDQAGKHLVAIEEHFGTALRENPETKPQQANQLVS